jgi:hypothetical protein
MDGVVADCADHESPASLSGHELRPCWSWLPWLAEVSELADVVDLYLAGALAHLIPFARSRVISSLRWWPGLVRGRR